MLSLSASLTMWEGVPFGNRGGNAIFFSVCATSVATFHPFVTLPLLSEPVIVMWGRLMGR